MPPFRKKLLGGSQAYLPMFSLKIEKWAYAFMANDGHFVAKNFRIPPVSDMPLYQTK